MVVSRESKCFECFGKYLRGRLIPEDSASAYTIGYSGERQFCLGSDKNNK